MIVSKTEKLLQALPDVVLNNTHVTFTPAHQEYLDVFELNPGSYSLSQIAAIWNQIIEQTQNPEEESTTVDTASRLCFRLIARVYHAKGVRLSYPNVSAETFQTILKEEFHADSNEPLLSLPPSRAKSVELGSRRLRALLLLIALGAELNLLLRIPTWLQSVFQHVPQTQQEKQN